MASAIASAWRRRIGGYEEVGETRKELGAGEEEGDGSRRQRRRERRRLCRDASIDDDDVVVAVDCRPGSPPGLEPRADAPSSSTTAAAVVVAAESKGTTRAAALLAVALVLALIVSGRIPVASLPSGEGGGGGGGGSASLLSLGSPPPATAASETETEPRDAPCHSRGGRGVGGGVGRTATVLQTSMGEPSLRWAEVPACPSSATTPSWRRLAREAGGAGNPPGRRRNRSRIFGEWGGGRGGRALAVLAQLFHRREPNGGGGDGNHNKGSTGGDNDKGNGGDDPSPSSTATAAATSPAVAEIRVRFGVDDDDEDDDSAAAADPERKQLTSASSSGSSSSSSSDPPRLRPSILGFGASFTESAARNYESLSPLGKSAAMELLYGRNGLGYTLGRVHMNSCDFCEQSYAFHDKDKDFELKSFDVGVGHDVETGMVDMMVTAASVLKEGWGGGVGVDNGEGKGEGKGEGSLKIIASPWSPPMWMKRPSVDDPPGSEHATTMTGSDEPTCLREGTGPFSRYAQSWALYFSKFVSAYKDMGVDLWAVTVQNEPEFNVRGLWESCVYTPDTEGEFIAYHLGPTLRRDHPTVRLLAFDHNKDHVLDWMKKLLHPANPASEYVGGTGVHWYDAHGPHLDGASGTPNMHGLAQTRSERGYADDHVMIGTEACHCPSTGYALGNLSVLWSRAERYAHDILSDLSAESNGWIEFNMLLDAAGGPNRFENLCDAPLLAVPHRADGGSSANRGASSSSSPPIDPLELEPSRRRPTIAGDELSVDELEARWGLPSEYLKVGIAVQPMYYYVGHISRHVRPGARAVEAIVDGSGPFGFGRVFRRRDGDGDDGGGRPRPGGGRNALARESIEVTLWPCEGSTRQAWTHGADGRIRATVGADGDGDDDDGGVGDAHVCLGRVADASLGGILLTGCDSGSAGIFVAKGRPGGGGTQLRLKNGEAIYAEAAMGCLLVGPLKNGGGTLGERGGAQAVVGECRDPTSYGWSVDGRSGEIVSTRFAPSSDGDDDDDAGTRDPDGREVCLTTGWPFLQAGAFRNDVGDVDSSSGGRSPNEKVVVVLNEADQAAEYDVRDESNGTVLSASIPARSIQTLLL